LNTQVLFPSLSRKTQATFGHVGFMRSWGVLRNIRSNTNCVCSTLPVS